MYILFFSELCEAVREQDEKQLQKSLPLLQNKLSKTAGAISDCLHTKDVAQAWYALINCYWMIFNMVVHNFQWHLTVWICGISAQSEVKKTEILLNALCSTVAETSDRLSSLPSTAGQKQCILCPSYSICPFCKATNKVICAFKNYRKTNMKKFLWVWNCPQRTKINGMKIIDMSIM